MVPESKASIASSMRIESSTERTFNDLLGCRWIVYERMIGSGRSGRANCLFFESPFAMRRVAHYPADWYALGKPALEALSWGT